MPIFKYNAMSIRIHPGVPNSRFPTRFRSIPILISRPFWARPNARPIAFTCQGLETVGGELNISARSEDRVIEGIETPDGRIIGVQFHPEKMPHTIFDRIFDHLLTQAQARS